MLFRNESGPLAVWTGPEIDSKCLSIQKNRGEPKTRNDANSLS